MRVGQRVVGFRDEHAFADGHRRVRNGALDVQADESAVLNGDKPGPHKIQGISTGFIPDTLDTKSYDSVVRIPSDEAIATSRTLGSQEGFLAGISSGAAIAAALKVAAELGEGKKVLTLLPDNGERYLSTTLYDFQD